MQTMRGITGRATHFMAGWTRRQSWRPPPTAVVYATAGRGGPALPPVGGPACGRGHPAGGNLRGKRLRRRRRRGQGAAPRPVCPCKTSGRARFGARPGAAWWPGQQARRLRVGQRAYVNPSPPACASLGAQGAGVNTGKRRATGALQHRAEQSPRGQHDCRSPRMAAPTCSCSSAARRQAGPEANRVHRLRLDGAERMRMLIQDLLAYPGVHQWPPLDPTPAAGPWTRRSATCR